VASDDEGNAKGFAFVEFEDEVCRFTPISYLNIQSLQMTARAALAANNAELKNRRIAVTMADSRVKARNK
jgi:hypothetical protein